MSTIEIQHNPNRKERRRHTAGKRSLRAVWRDTKGSERVNRHMAIDGQINIEKKNAVTNLMNNACQQLENTLSTSCEQVVSFCITQ